MRKLTYLLLAILIIWNVGLTVELNNRQVSTSEQNETVVVENTVNGFSTDLTKIYPDIQSSIVTVKTDKSIASGIIVRQEDDITNVVTNYHAIEDAELITVILDNFKTSIARVVGYDISSDVAVLEIVVNYNIPPIKFGDSSLLKKGEFVLAIGTPISSDYRGSMSLGIVSSPYRILDVEIDERNYYINMIQSDVTMNSGNSGGALVNMAGELVGLNTMVLEVEDAKDMSFSLPSNELKLIIDEIIEKGYASKVNLGLKIYPVSEMKNYQKNNIGILLDQVDGLYVTNVKLDFDGYYVGLKEGDIILEINGMPTNTIDDYIKEEYLVENHVVIKILRNGSILTLEGEIGIND